MDTWLAAETVGVPQGTLVHLVGEVDVATFAEFRTTLQAHIRPRTTLIVDLSGVTFLSFAGARALQQRHQELTSAGGRLVVWRPHPAPAHTLQVSRLGVGLVVHHGPLFALP